MTLKMIKKFSFFERERSEVVLSTQADTNIQRYIYHTKTRLDGAAECGRHPIQVLSGVVRTDSISSVLLAR